MTQNSRSSNLRTLAGLRVVPVPFRPLLLCDSKYSAVLVLYPTSHVMYRGLLTHASQEMLGGRGIVEVQNDH